MPRPATGSVWHSDGRIYARITWTDRDGERRDRKRKAMDDTHARTLCREMLDELKSRKFVRVQPRRAKRYHRNNLQVYCIQLLDGSVNPIKIGTSCDIPKRIKAILTHSPYEATLLASWPGTVLDERAVHSMFTTSRIAREWFRPTPELLKYIATKTEVAA